MRWATAHLALGQQPLLTELATVVLPLHCKMKVATPTLHAFLLHSYVIWLVVLGLRRSERLLSPRWPSASAPLPRQLMASLHEDQLSPTAHYLRMRR